MPSSRRCASGACAASRRIPAAWLTQAARHNALDRLRRETRYRDKLALLAEPDVVEPIAAGDGDADERLAAAVRMLSPRARRRMRSSP